MFLDESGDHNLNRINPNYPVFVLGGVIVDRAYTRDIIEPAMRAFKRRYFGREDVLLHTVDMSRAAAEYAFLDDPEERSRFYADLNALLGGWDYQVVACVVKKPELVARYGAAAADPYMFSLHVLVERFCKELGEEVDSGFICVEKRNPKLDGELMKAWESLRTRGTRYTSGQTIDRRIVGLDLRDKKPNLAGLQLADLVITPIGRFVAEKPAKTSQVQWSVVEKKLRRVGDRYMGRGLVIRPLAKKERQRTAPQYLHLSRDCSTVPGYGGWYRV